MVICVPDTVEWVSLVTGCMVQLTFGWYWNKNSGDYQAVTERARQMYFEFCDQNGLCDVIDCDEVAACIDESENVRRAISNIFNSGGGTNPVGEPLPIERMAENIVEGSNPTCNKDILWAQCIGLIGWCDLAIGQFFEGFETLTNTLEIAAAASKLPVLDEIGADAIADYAQMAQDAIQENYAADYTPTYPIILACEIFCACRLDCEITLDRIFDILLSRVQAQIGGLVDLDNLTDMLNDILSMDIEVVNVADILFMMLFGSAKLANFGLNITAAFDAIQRAILIFDEPNNDWEVECTFCTDVWSFTYDFEVENGGFAVVSSAAKYDVGLGWGVNSPTNTNTIAIQRTLPAGDYTSIEFEADVAPAYVSLIQVRTANYPGGSTISQQRNEPGTAITKLEGTWTNPGSVFVNYSKTSGTTLSGYTGKLKRVTFKGTGTNPFV